MTDIEPTITNPTGVCKIINRPKLSFSLSLSFCVVCRMRQCAINYDDASIETENKHCIDPNLSSLGWLLARVPIALNPRHEITLSHNERNKIIEHFYFEHNSDSQYENVAPLQTMTTTTTMTMCTKWKAKNTQRNWIKCSFVLAAHMLFCISLLIIALFRWWRETILHTAQQCSANQQQRQLNNDTKKKIKVREKLDVVVAVVVAHSFK